MMKRVLVCFACVILAGVCTALDQAQFDADVCYMTNKILTGTIRHVRHTVYPWLSAYQKRRGLSDEDFTRELLFIASTKRLNGKENERERNRKECAWLQTMHYLAVLNIPLKESVDFYEEILQNGQGEEMFETVYNYVGLVGCTPEYFEKIDSFLADKERRKDSARNQLLYAVQGNCYYQMFLRKPPISNVVSNRIVEYMEKRVRKDSVDACYFLDTLCKAKPEFKESEEWFERVRAILADESLNEYQHKPYRDQLREVEKRRKEKEEKK